MDFSSLKGAYRKAMEVLRTHKMLAVILLGLLVAATSGKLLSGNLLGNPAIVFGGAGTGIEDSLRSCSGMHTIFANFETIAETQQLYIQEMSGVFSEHETILRTPSSWKCGAGQTGEPSMPLLSSLVQDLPGWHVLPATGATPVERPVTFTAFSGVVAELQREYECKLLEMEDRSVAAVAENKDQAPGTFCCTEQGCMDAGDGSACVSGTTDSSTCNDQCPVYLTDEDLQRRPSVFERAIDDERERSRNALERSLLALRAADMNYELARQLTCYERASLDLRNELSLTADAISCMPKIWDALTSIHDKKAP